jgi:hypothetical protein
MRWHVYGTDTGTGRDVVLGLDEDEATHAVQAAMSKRILVSHVTQEAGEGLRRTLMPFACAALVVMIPICIAVYVQNINIRERLRAAVDEQTRLAQTAAQAETLAASIRLGAATQPGASATPADADDLAQKVAELTAMLASARDRIKQVEDRSSTDSQRRSELERIAMEMPVIQQRLQDQKDAFQKAQAEAARLAGENAMQRRRINELANTPDPAVAKLHQAEAANKELAAQVDLLKSQLLVAAATTPAPATTVPDTAPALPQPARWALRVDFDAASEFLRLNFDKDTFRTTPTTDGTLASFGAAPQNALTLRILHNGQKDRVYSGLLTAPVESPRDKASENAALTAKFLRTFAPSCDKPEQIIAAAVAQVAGKGPNERWVKLGDDYKLTVWNSSPGELTFKIESPRAELED